VPRLLRALDALLAHTRVGGHTYACQQTWRTDVDGHTSGDCTCGLDAMRDKIRRGDL
jgi:hypothetical protein